MDKHILYTNFAISSLFKVSVVIDDIGTIKSGHYIYIIVNSLTTMLRVVSL